MLNFHFQFSYHLLGVYFRWFIVQMKVSDRPDQGLERFPYLRPLISDPPPQTPHLRHPNSDPRVRSPSQAPHLRTSTSDPPSQTPISSHHLRHPNSDPRVRSPSQAPHLRTSTSDPPSQTPSQATISGPPPQTIHKKKNKSAIICIFLSKSPWVNKVSLSYPILHSRPQS